MEPALTKMTDEEKARNCHGPHRMYEWTDEDLGTYPSSLPRAFPDVHHNRAKYVVDYRPPTSHVLSGEGAGYVQREGGYVQGVRIHSFPHC